MERRANINFLVVEVCFCDEKTLVVVGLNGGVIGF